MIQNKRTFIVAELSANHNNDYDLTVKTIEAMAKAGADAVKIQTYKPASLTVDLNTGYFAPRTEGLWKDYTPWQLYSEATMPYEWQPKLKRIADKLGLIFFSSPFDKEGVDFLETMNVPLYKIASPEITDIPLVEYVALKNKPIIVSTGLAEIEDIRLILTICRNLGNNQITLLKCTSQYPATIEEANLSTIPDMKKRFGVDVGISDHTMGHIVPVVAVALGATVVEKHFTLDRKLGGVDATFSMEPHEFKEMVDAIRQVESALGKVTYEVSEKDKNRRRSLFTTEDMKAGDIITEQNVRSVRPGYGLHPKYYRQILGKHINSNVSKGTPLNMKFISDN
ncbi:MAG: pseudaminic acid synthase [Bacteroidales bacterium]|jgi:pseudaminic acid synthase|nr:pseudaminic acid synthase [Bacteroidales bacterium]